MRLSSIAVFAAALAAGPLSMDALQAQTYPTKPIRIIVPYSEGGVADVVARTVGARIAETMGQPVLIENKAGADGIIGAAAVAQAPADGYTLLLASSSLTIAPSLHSNAPTPSSFAAIALIGEVPSVIIVKPSVPAKSLSEFVQYAKSRPGAINYGSAGTSSIIHLAALMLQQAAGLQMTHIPYKGQPDALYGLLGGHLQMMVLTIALAKSRVESGEVRALAVTSTKRSAALPNVPTVIESGYPNYEATTWFGFVAPAGTPTAIISRLNVEINAAVKHPAVKQALNALGAELSGTGSPQQFQSLLEADLERWSKVVKQAGIKVD